MLALFASAFAAPSSRVGIGVAATSEAARRKRVVESFMLDCCTVESSC